MDESRSQVSLVDALADCLEGLSAGEGVERYLERYPEHRETLALLLDVARRVRPFPEADARPRKRFEGIGRRKVAKLRPVRRAGKPADGQG